MGLPATSVWEVRPGTSGSGMYSSADGGTDYSQQPAPEIADPSDWETKGGIYTKLYSASEDANLVAALTDNSILISGDGGTGSFTPGYYHIVSVGNDGGGNFITVDRNAATGNAADGNGVVGGAMGDIDDICDNALSGHIAHILSGTYTLAGGQVLPNGAANTPIKWIGYTSSREDEPVGTDRPLIQLGANAFSTGTYSRLYDLRFTSTHATGLNVAQTFCFFRNVKVQNTGAGFAWYIQNTPTVLIGCEAIADGSIGFNLVVAGIRLLYCSVHDCSSHGVSFPNVTNITIHHCEITHNSGAGIWIDSFANGIEITHNTISDNTGDGIELDGGQPYAILIFNNQITYNGNYGIDMEGGDGDRYYIDYNNYFGNTTAAVNGTPTPALNETTNDPGYTNKTNRDYSDVDDSDGYAMQLGVS